MEGVCGFFFLFSFSMNFSAVNLVSFISLISEVGEVTFKPSLDIDKKVLHGWSPDFLSRWRWRGLAQSKLIKQGSRVTLNVTD